MIIGRFYEEGDAASLVIPVNSQFRKNIDWLDDNFPREVKQATLFWKENYFTKHLQFLAIFLSPD